MILDKTDTLDKPQLIDGLVAQRGTLRHILRTSDDDAMAHLKRTITPEHFQDEHCRAVATALWMCYENNDPFDFEAVGKYLQEGLELEAFTALFSEVMPTPTGGAHRFIDCAHTVLNWKRVAAKANDNGNASASTCSGFKLHSLAEIAARPPREHLIEGVLYADGTSLITAKQATYKTFFALDMALCVATGDAWHGRAVKSGAVVYIAAEGAAGIVKRVQAWCAEHRCELPANFHIIDEPAQIADAAVRARFIETVAAVEPALIVVDTLARCAVGMDENSAKDMGEFVEALRVLAAHTGAHVQTVHHKGSLHETEKIVR